MPISRLVAESFKRPLSLANRTLDRIGSVLRFETAWLTVERPRLKSCCLQVILTISSSRHNQKSIQTFVVSIPYFVPGVNKLRRRPVSGLERGVGCHPERSEG